MIVDKCSKIWETKHISFKEINKNYDYGIVLGGYSAYNEEINHINLNKNGDRLITAIELYHLGVIEKLLISGGNGQLFNNGLKESDWTYDILINLKVDSNDIILENISRNTMENAKECKKIISNKTSSLKKRLKLRRQQFLPMAEINVTPFVDVMLVLLIIFMVAAPLLSVGVKVDLPETEARPLPTEKEKPLTLTIDEEENIFINEVKVSRDQLKMKLVSIKRERNSDKIFLRASGQLQYERVAKLMGILTQSGFNAVSLVTDSE